MSTTATKFYPVFVSPQNSPDSIQVFAEPGLTNMSREPRTEGWLGSTNNVDRNALGEFDSLDACKSAMVEKYGDLHDIETEGYDDILAEWGIGEAPTVGYDVTVSWCLDGAKSDAISCKKRGLTAEQAREEILGYSCWTEIQDSGGGDEFLLDKKGVEDAVKMAVAQVYVDEE